MYALLRLYSSPDHKEKAGVRPSACAAGESDWNVRPDLYAVVMVGSLYNSCAIFVSCATDGSFDTWPHSFTAPAQ